MLCSDKEEDGVDRSLTEDASLFLWFVNSVNSDRYYRAVREDYVPLAPRKKIHQKIKFKAYSMSAESIMHERKGRIIFEEDRNGFICVHCDARYIYKRCLVNHLIKSHHINSNILSKTFHG
ncbi:hypothetical protein [Encephalitozoon cuniculi GB-M1]|uniref:Uncharacterized protein n=2 Tax=Encephalitozoon cuniculi TaxID=6035 RepID=Q8SW48_ENCCU|nr:uncharacterized protein ECU03_0690 [Encephalitozoon cuniculi GB-M1]AGE95992.1 hypothetical protein ECU03_0690 [Encephalitozoon cuniculi]KMV66433.1 hypothetical protein M970_030630 [Encephalitozoon cuniculi EcunIII-L]UYI28060.1 hypothetical protein J0A71_09g19560 [Encephalitozoon cuniculi]CAD26215.1 hypothetical protein [Encephalitozoon cuniculi GB-M1]